MRQILRLAVILVRWVLPEWNHCIIYANALPLAPAVELSIVSGVLLAIAVAVLFKSSTGHARKGSLKYNIELAVRGLEFMTICLLLVLTVVHIHDRPLWLVVTGLAVETVLLLSTGWIAKLIRQVDEYWEHG